MTEGCFFAAVEAVGPGADGQALQGDRVHTKTSCAGAASPTQETADCHGGTQQSKGMRHCAYTHIVHNENIKVCMYILICRCMMYIDVYVYMYTICTYICNRIGA